MPPGALTGRVPSDCSLAMRSGMPGQTVLRHRSNNGICACLVFVCLLPTPDAAWWFVRRPPVCSSVRLVAPPRSLAAGRAGPASGSAARHVQPSRRLIPVLPESAM